MINWAAIHKPFVNNSQEEHVSTIEKEAKKLKLRILPFSCSHNLMHVHKVFEIKMLCDLYVF